MATVALNDPVLVVCCHLQLNNTTLTPAGILLPTRAMQMRLPQQQQAAEVAAPEAAAATALPPDVVALLPPDLVARLPPDVVAHVFSLLPFNDQHMTVALLSRAWHQWALQQRGGALLFRPRRSQLLPMHAVRHA